MQVHMAEQQMDALLPCKKDKFMFSNTFQEQGRKECSFLIETALNLKSWSAPKLFRGHS